MLKKTRRVLLLLLAAASAGFAQTPWTGFPEQNIPHQSDTRRDIQPRQYHTVKLDVAQLRPLLAAAPQRFSAEAADAGAVLPLPLPDGRIVHFRLSESPVMAPALQAQYPEIRCYTGVGIDDPTASLKCDLTPQGFHAMIRSAQTGTVFIDPYRRGDTEHYIVYFKKDFATQKQLPACLTEAEAKRNDKVSGAAPDIQGDCQLRRYRLALACTGEYAQFHGGTTLLALAAMNTTVNRVNDIYERDLAITLQLIANNNLLVFLNAATDGYTNGNGLTMLTENQTKCNTVIGSANYDIGHVVSTGGGGVSNLGVVCNNATKAQGVTGSPQPIGDPFDVDFVAHEMGHQFGANHTFNSSCGNNINPGTAFEPGSGSTVMGYAGICPPDVQNNSDDYFHAVSIAEITAYAVTGPGNVCAVKVNTGNTAPVVNAGPDRVIPKSTPFALTANATDPNGPVLTYCWEQMDNQPAVAPPEANATAGPLFRSFDPAASPTRIFPNLTDLVNNVNPDWEELPGVARTLNFRVTVRDNNPAGGCTHEDDLKLTVAANAGPFRVTAPNSAGTWLAGDEQTITWDVANTQLAPVNCAQVRISLSTDGGLTYPVVLANNVPNTGSAPIDVPNAVSTTCRVKVEAVGNVFFDISDQNFEIKLPPAPSFILSRSVSAAQICTGGNLQFTASVEPLSGFNGAVQLSLSGAPAGATVQISPNPLSPGGMATVDVSNLSVPGAYTLTLQGQSGSIVRTRTVALDVLNGAPVVPAPGSPADGSGSVSQGPVLSWAAVANANTYQVQVATNPAFSPGSIILDTDVAGLSAQASGLDSAAVYYWRIRAKNPCGQSDFSAPAAFQTGRPECTFQFNSTNVPVNISSTAIVTVSSNLNVPLNRSVADVDVSMQVTHSWVGDLVARLISPAGTTVTLFDQPGFPATDFGCDGNNLNVTLNDEAALTATALENTCGNNPAISGSFQSLELLRGFDNENAQGNWRLEVSDNYDEDGGALTAWSLKFCFFDTLPPAVLAANNPLTVLTGTGSDIGLQHLIVQTASGNPAQGVFTVLSLPQHGALTLNGAPLAVGGTFTQLDILNGLLHYDHGGDGATADAFHFDVQDESSNGWLHDQVFQIDILQNNLVVTAGISKNIRCAGEANGQITVQVQGGTPPLAYSLNGGAPQFLNVFDNLAAGTYTVVVTDQVGFTKTSNAVTLNNPPMLTAALSVSFDDIFVNASGGTGTLEYSLDGQNFQSSNQFQNLPNGTYQVTVRDANGCTALAGGTVDVEPLAVSLAVSGPILCAGGANGALTATASGGVPPLSYSLNGGAFQSGNTFGNLSAGTYTVVVKDDSGNTAAATAVALNNPPSLQATTSVTDDDISVSASGGTGALAYSLDGQNFQSSPLFENQPNGFYTVTVRDANGCTTTAQAIVAVDELLVELKIVSENACNGDANVKLSVTAAGGVEPYQYSLNGIDFQPENTFEGLPAGTYTVVVKDDSGNTATSNSVTASDPPALLLALAVDLNKITATASGGTGALEYSIDGAAFQPAGVFGGLANGGYTVTVRDANGCTATQTAAVDVPPLQIAGISSSGIFTCSGADFTFTLMAAGGIPPYQYNIDNSPFQDDNTFEHVGSGTHVLRVRDAMGTEVETSPITIADVIPLAASASVTANDATVQASGGTPPYQYTLGGPLQGSGIFENLPNGTYTVIVVDVNGCTATTQFTVSYELMSATVEVFHPSCAGASDGTATVQVQGGTPPYSFTGPSGDLGAGTYTASVTDAIGDTLSISFTLIDPPVLMLSATVSGDTITGAGSGGTGALQYSLDGVAYQDSPVFPDLPNGTYTLWVRDEHGCVTKLEGLVVDVIGAPEVAQAWGLHVRPNPSDGFFRLSAEQLPEGALQAQVFDATGRRLLDRHFEPANGLLAETLDLSALPAGVYWLRLHSGAAAAMVKLVVE